MTDSLQEGTTTNEESPVRGYTAAATLAFVTAVSIVILIHESSHVVAGLALGYENVLFPFGVTHQPKPSQADAAIAALTGPAFSLITGAIAMAWQPFRKRAGYGQLLWLWLAWVSLMEGVGYLLLAPFGIGDTGTTAASYDAAMWVTAPIGALGVAGTIWLAARFAVPLLRHTDGSLHAMRSMAFYPWMIGTAIALALAAFYVVRAGSDFGADAQFGVLLGTFALGVWAPMSIPFTHRVRARRPQMVGAQQLRISKVPVAGVVLLLAVVALNVFVLGQGLSIG